MSILAAHIPLIFGALCSLVTIISMSAVTVTGYRYLRAMEASQARIRAEQDNSRHPRY
jgi:hypothetical protein